MKHLLFILTFILTAISVKAEDDNPFIDIYKKHFTGICPDVTDLKSFIGDSIYFKIQGNLPLTNVLQEVPDTIWIKEKKSKKLKEGKDYLLCYNYKGIKDGKSFYTPSAAIDRKPFGLLSVKEIREGSYYPITVGYELTLVDPEKLNLIHIILDKTLPSEWKLYSLKTNAVIDSWIGKTFYKKEGYSSDITECTLTFGDLYLGMAPAIEKLVLDPQAEFILTVQGSEPLQLKYNTGADGSPYLHKSIKFLSRTEYEKELEKSKVYSINYEFSNDTTFVDKVKPLPFRNIWGKTTGYINYVSQTIKPGYSPLGNHTIPNETYVLIGDKLTVRGVDYYKAVLDGRAFYIECSKIELDEPGDIEILVSQPQDTRDAFFEVAKIISRLSFYKERVANLEAFQKVMKRGLIVEQAQPYDMSEYTDGTGMEFSFLNTSDKTIKYITVNFIGYNAVDDPVSSGGRTLLTRKGIGPIAPFETGSYEFEYVWFTDIVQYSKTRSITVQYTDGTSRTFKGEAVEIVPDEVINALNYKSPVADFLPDLEPKDDTEE